MNKACTLAMDIENLLQMGSNGVVNSMWMEAEV